jgi:FAD/FMN-containing dehydrogenase
MNGTLALPLSAIELRDAVRSSSRFDTARLDRVLRLDPARGHVEVQASASWAGLAAGLGDSAAELPTLWAHAPATIGASVAKNSAGPDGRPLVSHIEGLAMVTPDGELRRVSRLANPELFKLAVGGQGAFGACYSVTLNVQSLMRSTRESQPGTTLTLPGAGSKARLLQLLIPPEALEAFLAECRSRCDEWRTAIEGVQVRRTLVESETVLRWARREYAEVSLFLGELRTIGGSVRATQLRRELIDAAIARSGSFPIACTPEATRAHVEACYPQLKTVLAEKRRFDPAEKLTNAWYRHYSSLLIRESCDVRWSN